MILYRQKIGVKKRNIRKGFAILCPQKVCVSLYFLHCISAQYEETFKKPSFAFASSLLPAPVILKSSWEGDKGKKKKDTDVHEKQE